MTTENNRPSLNLVLQVAAVSVSAALVFAVLMTRPMSTGAAMRSGLTLPTGVTDTANRTVPHTSGKIEPFVPPLPEERPPVGPTPEEKRRTKLADLRAKLVQKFSAQDFANAAHTCEAIFALDNTANDDAEMRKQYEYCRSMAKAKKFERAGNADQALKLLWPLAASETAPDRREAARKRIERINTARAGARSLFAAAQSRMKRGARDDAKELLRTIRTKYPYTPEAAKAAVMLSELDDGDGE